MAAVPFIDLPLDKWRWHPSPLAGQVVYALTRSAEGELDVAPKSWIQMAGFGGPLLSLGCSRRHRTRDNFVGTGRFTLSFPTIEQARLARAVADAPRDERVAVSGLSPEESTSGGVAHLRECPAYCECELYREVALEGDEVLVLGRITRLAVHDDVVGAPTREAYALLAPGFFLEPGVMTGLAPAD